MESHYFNSDCVLNPEHMLKNTKYVVIEDGLHDLALSPKPVREKYFKEVIVWLQALNK